MSRGACVPPKSTSPVDTASVDRVHVVVVGACGDIGQPLSLLLKMNPDVTRLSLYDVGASPAAAELNASCHGDGTEWVVHAAGPV